MKKVKVIKTVISVIVIILVLLSLFDIINGEITNSIVLLYFGIMGMLEGYCSHKNNKKRESIFLFLFGIVLIFVSAITTFF